MSKDKPSDRTPRAHSARFNCPHCDAFAGQIWLTVGYVGDDGSFESLDTHFEDDPWDSHGPPALRPSWYAAQCSSCDKLSVWNVDKMIYPLQRVGAPTHPDMPPAARELHAEAAAVAAVSRRAGAAMARAALERLIKAVDNEAPKRSTLEQRIARLQGRVSTPLGQLLDVVRVTGNSALHQSSDVESGIVTIVLNDQEGPELLTLLLQAANDLVDELITRPRVADELWNRLPDDIRARSQFGAETGK